MKKHTYQPSQVQLADRRRHPVLLTECGLQALATTLPCWQQAQSQVVLCLGQEQWHALLAELHTAVTLAQPF